ncbi:methylmalonyl-CoA epimerase [Desmospora activa]|uniref:Methylmalonyl-CoA epimerase n=1 Tax=Desmospora activa DSM 45169 TaxID=1121389 RepID=A0A2T4Z9M1_9BACL|nr:methylmalonyl-CoA epimerase [Desmospora activa]PTM58582.1 methylmalonyl-CoA epimerase [Desmospora activa DSM 45169]
MIPLHPHKIDHIGIAVRSLRKALPLYRDVWGMEYLGEETVVSEGVRVAFFRLGESKVELLEPLSDDSPIARFIHKRGEGVHHVALRVGNLEERLQQLKVAGIELINDQPKRGAGGNRVAFLHPRSTGGVLYELCEPAKTDE